MPVAGIVAEYNPFHLGHAHHLAQTRKQLGPDGGIVCVMSGNWVQRGDCAVADKWSRSTLAVLGGADLVIELPTPWAMSSAESFARGATGLLDALGVVDILSFGSETGVLPPLLSAAAALDSPDYPLRLQAALSEGLSFPAARQKAAGCSCLSTPNNNLGVEYLRALQALGSSIQPMTIIRQGAAHDSGELSDSGFVSASYIRSLLRQGQRGQAASLLPHSSLELMGEPSSLAWMERGILARLRTMREADWAALPDSGQREGLPARLVSAVKAATSLEQFYSLAKTKRYTHARLRRLVLSAFLGLDADIRPDAVPYVRVLCANRRGQALLKKMKRCCSLPIITKPAHAKAMGDSARRLFEAESRYTDLYALCFPVPKCCGAEWVNSPGMFPE